MESVSAGAPHGGRGNCSGEADGVLHSSFENPYVHTYIVGGCRICRVGVRDGIPMCATKPKECIIRELSCARR
jgi:hypothetical protein